MKYLLAAFISLASFTSHAQCEDIEKDYDEMKGTTDYSIKNGFRDPITVARLIHPSDKLDAIVIYFYLHNSISDYNAKGIYVKFEDGTIMKDETAKVDCHIIDIDNYRYTGYIVINNSNLSDFESKKIVKIQLGDTNQEIKNKLADNIKAYVKCLADIKP